MKNLSSLINSLEMFNAYIQGKSFSKLKSHMEFYDEHLIKLNRDYHLISPTDELIVEQIKKVLENLNIPKEKWDDYLKKETVYDFLTSLYKEGHEQINDIIKLIDEKTAKSKLLLIGGSLASATLIGSILSIPAMSGVLAAIKGFLSSAVGMPILGLAYTSAVGLYSIYQNHFDNKKSLFKRFRDNLFVLANSALNVAAYGVWLASAAAMTPLAGALFVAASAVDVVKELFGLGQEYYKNQTRLPTVGANSLAVKQEQKRHEFAYTKHRNSLLINLTSSLLLVGIMAVWCFVPGGLFVSIAAVAAMGVVYTAKTLANKYNEKVTREGLQKELKELATQHQEEPSADLQNNEQPLLQHEHSAQIDSAIKPVDEPVLNKSLYMLIAKPKLEKESAQPTDITEARTSNPRTSSPQVTSLTFSTLDPPETTTDIPVDEEENSLKPGN